MTIGTVQTAAKQKIATILSIWQADLFLAYGRRTQINFWNIQKKIQVELYENIFDAL